MPSTIPEIYDSLARRLGDLGVWVWCVSPDGAILARPQNPALGRAPAEEVIARVAVTMPNDDGRTFADVDGGLRALRLPVRKTAGAPFLLAAAWAIDQSHLSG